MCNDCCTSEENEPYKSGLEAKIGVLIKMIQTMCTRIEKLEACYTGDSLDKKIEEEAEKKIAEASEEAQDRENRKLNITVSNLLKVQGDT